MESKFLKELGLTRNEAKIYLFLLRKGEITTGPIIKETKIVNSRVYESINSLISKGLVSYTIQKEGKHFQAVSPKKFLEIEEEKIKKIESKLPELLQIQKINKQETQSAVYEGFNGFKTAFKKIIEDCPENGTIYILGFSEKTFSTESLRRFLTNMNLKSAKKEQKLKIILDRSSRKTLGKDREREKFTEVKYLPSGFIGPAAVNIFGDFVYIFLWEEKPFVFMIKNKTIAESFKQYFSFLWKMARKVYKLGAVYL